MPDPRAAEPPARAVAAEGLRSSVGITTLIHDRFYSQWDQPTSIFDSSKSFVCTLQIRIEPNGKIAGVKVVRSSGNVIMDDSVMAAANRVLQIDPPPAALAAAEPTQSISISSCNETAIQCEAN